MQNKRIVFAILIVIFFVFCASSQEITENVQTDSLPQYSMSEIVIIGEKLPDIKFSSIHEIGAKQISVLDIKNAHEALKYSPGIYFSRTSKNETSFRLRGFEQRQVSVFLDGVPISIPYDGMVDISQFVGDNIASVRISRGLSSVLYGANTLGGTVNIITAAPVKETSLRLRLEGSSHKRIFTNINLTGGTEKIYFGGSIAYQKADNFSLPGSFSEMPNEKGGERDNSAYEQTSLSFKVQYQPVISHRFALNINYIDNSFNVPSNAQVSRPRYWQFPEWKKSVIGLTGNHIFSSRFILRTILFLDQYTNKLESFDDNSYSTQTQKFAFNSWYDDYSFGGILYPRFKILPFGISDLILSYKQDVHREKSEGNGTFDKYIMETYVLGIEQEFRFLKKTAALASAEFTFLNPLTAEDAHSRDPVSLLNGQMVLQHQIQQYLQLHLSAGQKSRFPTLKELYSERLGRNIASPELKAEDSFNMEFGVQWKKGEYSIQGALFNSQLKNLIVNRQLGDNIQQLQNVGEANFYGIELDYRYMGNQSGVNFNYTFLRAFNQSDNRESDFLEYRPKHRLNLLWHYNISTNLLSQLEGNYTVNQYYQDPDDSQWQKLNDFVLFNIKIDYLFTKQLVLYMRVNNLFDRNYMSEYGVPMPGREFVGGFKFKL